MSGLPIRVVTFSRHGSTDEVGRWVARSLAGLVDASVYQNDSTGDPETGLGAASRVVVGMPVYANHWRPEARRFLNRCASTLGQREVWLFTCSLGGGLDDLDHLEPELVPVGLAHFGGKLDWDRLAVPERMLMRALGQTSCDRRSRADVEAWAASIVRTAALT
ncbi:MAG: flavodoxin domain-containing protein [Bifidobacteriaceae bacterium]|jgi:menaquinone-dependent protoporphyrinogen IX oxidase|nr:flavodoxin domain-containing protein [Bifidobacteriaceae bacterium]